MTKKDNCTYLGPTALESEINKTLFKNFVISQDNIPIVTHLHGLEVRPTLDGNPMSWQGKNGQVGPAFQSILRNNEYFSSKFFKNPMKALMRSKDSKEKVYVKINRYNNTQPPGNLWYHDHSMSITRNNVANGLLGNYIIYNTEVEKQLPSKKYDISILAGQALYDDKVINEMDLKAYYMKDNPAGKFTSSV